MIWDRPSTSIPIQPAMELATSRVIGASHWASNNRNVKIGLAIAIPSFLLLLATTPATRTLAQAWKRVTGQTSKEKAACSERNDYRTNNGPPQVPKKSYAAAAADAPRSKKRVTRQEELILPGRGEYSTSDHTPRSPEKSYASAAAAPSWEPMSPLTPDDSSINSENSSEHTHKQKFKLGKNIKKRWQNRPFGHGSSESPLSP